MHRNLALLSIAALTSLLTAGCRDWRLVDESVAAVSVEGRFGSELDPAGEPELVDTPSASGKGQAIARCPRCRIALWSHYAGAGRAVSFVRVGTLDDPDVLPPDIHIFTASKQPWVVLPAGTPAVPEYYDRKQHWPAESLARREALLAGRPA